MNQVPEDDRLLRIASSIADAEAIDWDGVVGRHADLAPRLQQLRLIESIGNAHRANREELAGTSSIDDTWPPRRWGKLEIQECVGHGSFGDVYRALDPDLQLGVALKLQAAGGGADAAHGELFLREARRLAQVHHDNVVRVYGAERHAGRLGIWMEYLRGRSLEERLDTEGRMSANEALAIGVDLCRALAAVHGAGLIHRDVKTANVIREEGGRVVLLDFSAVVTRLNGSDSSRSEEPVSGTPRFMAPELFHGVAASVQSDLYALGVVLYRLVTGEYPTTASTVEELIERREDEWMVPLRDRRPDLPGAFVQVVERALAFAPELRYQSAGSMEAALESARSGSPRASKGVSTPPNPNPPAAWKRLGVLAGAAAVLAIVVWALSRVGAPPDLEVGVEFYRETETARQRVNDGGQLALGDELSLELRSTRKAHVYVVNADRQGRAYLLFPIPGLDTSNPVAADTDVQLPGPAGGVTHDWIVDSAGGQETLLVIVSLKPLAEVEATIETLPASGTDAVEIGAQMLLRGIGGLEPRHDRDASAVEDLADRLTTLAANRTGLWVRSYRFGNPTPGSSDPFSSHVDDAADEVGRP